MPEDLILLPVIGFIPIEVQTDFTNCYDTIMPSELADLVNIFLTNLMCFGWMNPGGSEKTLMFFCEINIDFTGGDINPLRDNAGNIVFPRSIYNSSQIVLKDIGVQMAMCIYQHSESSRLQKENIGNTDEDYTQYSN